ncbi:hypothetical protein K491DRAFT_756891 [Lophiostoma macrostomum CBS 122681]|uniref:Nucleolar protein 12 n=1 Tax=Lophiostoma macrostomum CBS 122681 TaxID=1314788 RepID=A0A6A6TDA6_9PLEO|nr:hypothetical protein K491DRAFT_756891 [Lophiostoma macrostomum CBS 122681]
MPPPKKKLKSSAVAEISFDPAAREEYLTGFHKRKQARIKHAQEQAAKMEREERLRLRAQLRQKRKTDLESHVAEVNSLLKKAANGNLSETGDTSDNDEWEGFEEPVVDVVNQEDEYIDEDKYTTVTIESVGISRDGFEKAGVDEDSDGDGEGEGDKENGGEGGIAGGKKRVWTKEKPKTDRPKKRKKKFRYESKAERKATRMKQGAKNRAQAQARKSQ